ncbi:MAG: GNAT family N-acetyltransferase [Victivallales bacterium]|nr:GNAT family N-acetyltransferase [Victivallales bacterium]
MTDMSIVSLREEPERLDTFIGFFTSHWGKDATYRECMTASLNSPNALPQWFMMMDGETPVGGCGLLPHDFTTRMDLWPFLTALYVEKSYRGHGYGGMLIEHAKRECAKAGYRHLYLTSDHVGYYEKYGFRFAGMTADVFDSESRLYETTVTADWPELLAMAKSCLNARQISPLVSGGEVAAAILTESGNVYTGVCIDTASAQGMCAERNALSTMVTHGEQHVVKLVAVMPDGRNGAPCGACRELLMQLDSRNRDMEILMDYKSLRIAKLGDLLPEWWGDSI